MPVQISVGDGRFQPAAGLAGIFHPLHQSGESFRKSGLLQRILPALFLPIFDSGLDNLFEGALPMLMLFAMDELVNLPLLSGTRLRRW